MRKWRALVWVGGLLGCGSPGIIDGDRGIAVVADAAVRGDVRSSPDLAPDLRPDEGADVRLAPDAGEVCTKALADAGGSADGCSVPLPPARDLLDEALGKLGLDRCKASFRTYDPTVYALIYPADPYRFPFFERTHREALEAPRFARALSAELDRAAATDRPVTQALTVAAHHAGFGGAVCVPPSDPGGDHPLGAALVRLIRGTGGTPDAAQLEREADGLPLAFQRAMVPVVDALGYAAEARALALKDADIGKPGTSPGVTPELVFTYAASPALVNHSGLMLNQKDPWVQNVFQGGAKGFQVQHLYRAAVRLAAAIEGAKLGRFAGLAIAFVVDTPIGRILFRGAEDSVYDPSDPEVSGPIALLLDTGGDDTYRIPAGANVSVKNPVSVVIDLAGKDTYGYVEAPSPLDGTRLPSDSWGRAKPSDPSQGDGPISLSEDARQGAGRLGIGLLFDLGGKADRYSSLRMSQGFGALGVGVLYDDGGDDVYRGEAAVQGAGMFGIGLLLDGGGDDRYETYTLAQGFAYVKGVGVLYDAAGSDQYLANVGDPAQGGDPLYFSPQLPGTGTSSLTQGAAWGRRADFTDKLSQAGGLGVLRDRVGDDRYRTSVFGQATAYWYGTGILADGAGNDSYDGLWYVQGSAAHYSMAVFVDDAGDDRYDTGLKARATSLGVGHDCSVGWHLDLGGDDVYRAPFLSLGAGNDNGQGFFVNRGGKDSYATVGTTSLGAAYQSATAGWRTKAMTLGVFVDTEGADVYVHEEKPVDRNGKSWLYGTGSPATTYLFGIGLDGTGTVLLP
ncbi:MAG: hypothetical protein IT371_07850 [Deltaproteobacteria bacterium]|nr:hypothetical protein [Deltaproteobacteria bacterium]